MLSAGSNLASAFIAMLLRAMVNLRATFGPAAPAVWMALITLWGAIGALAQIAPPIQAQVRYPIPDLNPRRIMGIIPNYQTVSDPDHKTPR